MGMSSIRAGRRFEGRENSTTDPRLKLGQVG